MLLAIPTINADSITIYEDSPDQIQCLSGHKIFIKSASWTYDMLKLKNGFNINWRNPMFLFGKAINLCTYDVTAKIKDKCHAKETCQLAGSRAETNDECNYWMKLDVEYDCIDCTQITSGRHRRGIPFAINAIPTSYFCDLLATVPPIQWSNSCPSQRFESKHLCTRGANDEANAAMFATQANSARGTSNLSQPYLNSVFINHTAMQYNLISPNSCVFRSRASKYDCTYSSQTGIGTWSCNYMGEVIATHDLSTGHYNPRLDT